MQFLFNTLPWITLSDFRLDPRPSGLAIISLESSHHCTQTSYSTSSPDTLQVFLSDLIFYNLPIELSAHNLLIFLEFFTKSNLSPKVVRNYCSSVVSLAQFYGWNTAPASHPAVIRFLRAISINSHFRPTPRGVFDIKTMYDISRACDHLMTPLYSGQFFGGFLCLFQACQHSPTFS